MKTTTPVEIRLADYVKPNYEVSDFELEFQLAKDNTLVRTSARYRKIDDAPAAELVLDGKGLELVSVSIDGRRLEAGSYELGEETLTLTNLPGEFTLEIENTFSPEKNTELEGLYLSGTMLCTQCEAEGFRRITYFMDRPDVMTNYRTKLIASKDEYPVLLSNGNPVESGDLEDGKHFVVWEDPFKKPTYLFAVVAGDLGLVKGSFTTRSGREIDLRVYCDKGNESRCEYTLECLKKSMKWDEERFDLEYDLDIYMIVAVDSFNMGAMENKGLNIFNSKYVLASPETATDTTYFNIEAIVGHEYFHNWTGNRVTCRDWFQLTLKEGLTVFRDQEFSSDLNSRASVRISDMAKLKSRQFVEDAGPNAHPIKPKSYMDINNFYSSTVYEKGSEVIRMYHTLLGEEGFQKGMKRYFELYDGMAVTTEEFLHAMSVANNNYDFSHFSMWYDQSGTPTVSVKSSYDASAKELTLRLSQSTKPTKDQAEKIPLYFPFGIGLVAESGNDIPLTLKEPTSLNQDLSRGFLVLSKEEETFVFTGIEEKPTLSVNRNFSAPVLVDIDYSWEELVHLISNDSDPVARYSAVQIAHERVLKSLYKSFTSETDKPLIPREYFSALKTLLQDESVDDEFKALSLTLPSGGPLSLTIAPVDFTALSSCYEKLTEETGKALKKVSEKIVRSADLNKPYSFNPHDVGKRAVYGVCAKILCASGDEALIDLVHDRYLESKNMTDIMSNFSALVSQNTKYLEKVSDHFYEKHKKFGVLVQEWMKVLCSVKKQGAKMLEKVTAAEEFDLKIPNYVYASYGGFIGNLSSFHTPDGSGYKLLADKVIEVDSINSSVAAGLAVGFQQYAYLIPDQAALMKKELERVLEAPNLSKGTTEIVTKTLK